MPRLTPQRWRKLVKAFGLLGYSVSRQEGSHIVLVKPGAPRPLVIPCHGEVQVSIIKSNLRSAGITVEAFLRLLDEC